MTSAISRAVSRAVPSGTTRPMRPISLASWADTSPGGQQQVHGHRERDLAAQADGRAAEREQAPPGLEHAELGALAGHPDVGGLEDLGPAGHGPALHGGDQRLAQRSSGGAAPSSAGRGRRPSAPSRPRCRARTSTSGPCRRRRSRRRRSGWRTGCRRWRRSPPRRRPCRPASGRTGRSSPRGGSSSRRRSCPRPRRSGARWSIMVLLPSGRRTPSAPPRAPRRCVTGVRGHLRMATHGIWNAFYFPRRSRVGVGHRWPARPRPPATGQPRQRCRAGGHPHHRGVQRQPRPRAREHGVAEGEDPAVGRRQPVARAADRRGHARRRVRPGPCPRSSRRSRRRRRRRSRRRRRPASSRPAGARRGRPCPRWAGSGGDRRSSRRTAPSRRRRSRRRRRPAGSRGRRGRRRSRPPAR